MVLLVGFQHFIFWFIFNNHFILSGSHAPSVQTRICALKLISRRSYSYSYGQWRGISLSVEECSAVLDLCQFASVFLLGWQWCVWQISLCANKLQQWCRYFSLKWLISLWTVHIFEEGKSPVFQKISPRIKTDWLDSVCVCYWQK